MTTTSPPASYAIDLIEFDFDKCENALKSLIVRKGANLTYDAAMTALTRILEPALLNGKRVYKLTIKQLTDCGCTERTSRNAIQNLLKVGILMLKAESKWSPTHMATFAALYEVNPEFLMKRPAMNTKEAAKAIVQHGGTWSEAALVKSLLKEEGHSVITSSMIVERWVQLFSISLKRWSAASHFGKAGSL